MSWSPAWAWQFADGHRSSVAGLVGNERITRDWAWGDARGEGVKVAIIDSGVEAGHPAVGEVAGGVSISIDPDSGATVYEAGPHDDLFGHGTACAGIVRLAAPDCEIYSVRVLGPNLRGRATAFAAGIRWAIENGMHVVNMSMSTTRPAQFPVFHRLADQAYFANTVLVCAVNNLPLPSYPSEFAAVISVASAEGSDPFTYYYNPKPPVEFGAPGINVEVAWSNARTVTATGNSFACPHIAGLVARLLSKHPGLTPFQIKTVLCALASNTRE